jgi:hypothetical protein
MSRDSSTPPWGSFRRAPVRTTGASHFSQKGPAAGRQSYGAWRPAPEDKIGAMATDDVQASVVELESRSSRLNSEAA